MVLGLASSGLHSNGYSLVRKIVFEPAGLKVTDFVPELGRTVGEELLKPTRIYVQPIRQLVDHYPVKKRVVRGLAHITGGGLPDNVPASCRRASGVFVQARLVAVPPVFAWLQKLGNVADAEMVRVFNMGIGFVVICAPSFANSIVHQLTDSGIPAWVIGEVKDGEVGVEIA